MTTQSEHLDPEKLLDQYLTAVRDMELSRLAAFVVATAVIYDYIVTFDLEIVLIWGKRWSIIKAVYLWHRYFGILCVIFQVVALTYNGVNDGFCNFWIHWETWGYSALIFSSELVLILWIWVICNRSRLVLVTLLGLFAAEVTGVIVVLVISFRHTVGSAHLLPNMTYCFARGTVPSFKFLWVPILGFDTILLAIYLYQGYRTRGLHKRKGFSSMHMIYKHSLLNFLAIFASYLSCATMWIVAEPGLIQIPASFALALSITNCTRLLLNIRRAYYIGPSHMHLSNGSGLVIHSSGFGTPNSATPLASLRWARRDNSMESIRSQTMLDEDVDSSDTLYNGLGGPSGSHYEMNEIKSSAGEA